MEKLIQALQIFLKYDNPEFPTNCEHDVLWICGNYSNMTNDDKKSLDDLGFFWCEEYDAWKSFEYGSA